MENKIDIVLLFAYGEGKYINGKLFSVAKRFSEFYKVPIFTQKDMKLVDEFLKHSLNMDNQPIHIAKQEGNYISTLEVVDCFLNHPLQKEWTKVLVIAAPQHIKRCIGDCEAQCKDKTFYIQKHFRENPPWYDPTDPQKWVRSPWAWWRQEFLIRLIRFISYKFYANKARLHKGRN